MQTLSTGLLLQCRTYCIKPMIGESYDGQWAHGEMDRNCTYLSRGSYKFIGKFKNGHYSEGKLISYDKSYNEGTFGEMDRNRV